MHLSLFYVKYFHSTGYMQNLQKYQIHVNLRMYNIWNAINVSACFQSESIAVLWLSIIFSRANRKRFRLLNVKESRNAIVPFEVKNEVWYCLILFLKFQTHSHLLSQCLVTPLGESQNSKTLPFLSCKIFKILKQPLIRALYNVSDIWILKGKKIWQFKPVAKRIIKYQKKRGKSILRCNMYWSTIVDGVRQLSFVLSYVVTKSRIKK